MLVRYKNKSTRRKIRIRAKLRRLSSRLRLSIYRSNKHIYGQIIDDQKGKTLIAVSDKELKKSELGPKTKKITKEAIAMKVGELLAQKTKKKKIKEVYLDRGGYKYHGRIKALAQGARKGGLKI